MKTYKSQIPKIGLKKEFTGLKKAKIQSSADAYDYMKQFYSDDIEIYESMFLLLLNKANTTIGWVKLSQGGVAGTVIDIKLIAKYAVESLASSVVIAHNHPSGNIQPSNADINITKKVSDALKLFDVTLLDHLIVTIDNYYSMADEGDL